jgi:hypothetical protein
MELQELGICNPDLKRSWRASPHQRALLVHSKQEHVAKCQNRDLEEANGAASDQFRRHDTCSLNCEVKNGREERMERPPNVGDVRTQLRT